MTIAKLITRRRLRTRLNQTAFAREAGIDRVGLARWESGRVTPSIENAHRLAAFLGGEWQEYTLARAPKRRPVH